MTHRTDTRLALWLRVYFTVVEQHDGRGHLELEPGQLRQSLTIEGVAPSASDVSRAIRTAVRRGLLQSGSSTRHLVLGLAPVPAQARR